MGTLMRSRWRRPASGEEADEATRRTTSLLAVSLLPLSIKSPHSLTLLLPASLAAVALAAGTRPAAGYEIARRLMRGDLTWSTISFVLIENRRRICPGDVLCPRAPPWEEHCDVVSAVASGPSAAATAAGSGAAAGGAAGGALPKSFSSCANSHAVRRQLSFWEFSSLS